MASNENEIRKSKNVNATTDLMIQVATLRTELRKGVVKELERLTGAVDDWGEKLGKISTKVELIESNLCSVKKTVDKWGNHKLALEREGVRSRGLVIGVIIAGLFSVAATALALLK